MLELAQMSFTKTKGSFFHLNLMTMKDLANFMTASLLYFDNNFSSYHLLQILKQKGIMAACTARVNRFVKPPFLSDKVTNKKPRGFFQEVCSRDGDVTDVKWLDNKITHLASNFVGIGDKDLVKRWCKKRSDILRLRDLRS